jgi:hypothetical protein
MADKDSRDVAFKIAQSLLVASVTGIAIIVTLLPYQFGKAYFGEGLNFFGFLWFSLFLTIFSSFLYLISDYFSELQNKIKTCLFLYPCITFIFSFFLLLLILIPNYDSLKPIYENLEKLFNWRPEKYYLAIILFAIPLVLLVIELFSKPFKKIEEEKFKSS